MVGFMFRCLLLFSSCLTLVILVAWVFAFFSLCMLFCMLISVNMVFVLLQKQEWPIHKYECKCFVALLEEKGQILTSSLRLMLRILIKRHLQQNKVHKEEKILLSLMIIFIFESSIISMLRYLLS